MSQKFLYVFSGLLLFAFQGFSGGGWTHAKGTGYAKISEWWVTADQHYNANGTPVPNFKAGNFNTNFYAEYGITDKLEAMVYFPMVSSAFEEFADGTRETITTVGDTDVGVKYALIKDKGVVLSTQLWLGLPLGENEGGATGNLQTGDGEFNQMIGFTASSGGDVTDLLGVFGNIGFDYNNRTGGYSDEWRFNLDVGVILAKKVILVYKLTNLKSFNNGSLTEENPLGGLFSNNREYAAFTYEIGINITEKLGITGNYAGAYSAKNIFARPAYSIGAYYNF